MSGKKPVTIRKAKPSDATVILSLLQKLAEYENLLPNLKASADDLKASLSGENPKISGHIAECGERAVGFTTFFETFSTFSGCPKLYLEDIYVLPDYRHMGVAKHLFHEFAKEAKKRGCARLEWQVLYWNQPAIEFYKYLGAEPVTDWKPYGIAVEKILN